MSDTTPRPDEPHEDPTAPTAAESSSEAAAPHEQAPPAQEPTPEPPPAPAAQSPQAPPPPPPPPPQQAAQAQQAPQMPTGTVQAQMSPQDERTWSMATHGITLAVMILTSGVLGFVAALVMYLIYRDRGPYIRAQTANALNIQIVTVIGALISFVLMFVLIGFVTIVIVGVYALVMHIIGMVKSNNGEWWDPPFTPKFVS